MSAVPRVAEAEAAAPYTLLFGCARLRVPTGIHPATFAGYRWAGPSTPQQEMARAERTMFHAGPSDPIAAWVAIWREQTSSRTATV